MWSLRCGRRPRPGVADAGHGRPGRARGGSAHRPNPTNAVAGSPGGDTFAAAGGGRRRAKCAGCAPRGRSNRGQVSDRPVPPVDPLSIDGSCGCSPGSCLRVSSSSNPRGTGRSISCSRSSSRRSSSQRRPRGRTRCFCVRRKAGQAGAARPRGRRRFLVLVAALLELKGRELAPAGAAADDDALEELLDADAAAAELAQRLARYRWIRAAADWLRGRLEEHGEEPRLCSSSRPRSQSAAARIRR